jgi:NADH:ubiquinone oxidoreductase subunit E/NAD-dependent dihydropyrimidine dehydrogenase PreA subunit
MGEVSIVLDGRQLTVRSGMTILDVAKANGVFIPSLCHRPDLHPSGVCRVCVVEVEGNPRLAAACHTPVFERMVVHTKSRKVQDARKTTLQLLLTSHTGPCVLDSTASSCELHNLISSLEVSPPKFGFAKPRYYPIEERNPYVLRNLSKCILCRRCLAVCREVAGKNLFSIAYRAHGAKVVVEDDHVLNKEVCSGCGMCIEACPTGALKPGPLLLDRGSTCCEPHFEEKTCGREGLLENLRAEQKKEGFVRKAVMEELADRFGAALSEVYGLTSFHSFLSIRPLGRNVIRICRSLPCFLKSGHMIVKAIEEALGICPGETTSDWKFSLQLTNCIGACDKAPAMLVNQDLHGSLTDESIFDILKSYD